jgi:hypothetical protein
MRSAAAEPGRQRQRRPQIAHNDTRVKAGHHHPVVRRLQPQTTSSRSVALAALAVVTQRLHQHLGALPTLATSSQPGNLLRTGAETRIWRIGGRNRRRGRVLLLSSDGYAIGG